MLYQESDYAENQAAIRRERRIFYLLAIPGLLLCVAGFVIRNQILATVGLFLMFAEMIYVYDMRLGPLKKYRTFLEEIRKGMQHDTRGVLIRIGDSPVFTEGVYFREILINIYLDRGEDGERRFLLDWRKPVPEFAVGDYVVVHSHGVYVLGISPLEIQNETEN
ncbi:MAG: hypothetical protein IJ088_16410 [Clostridia bacterium]|nr:hypothetical protein [Clostridia bacterium]